MKKDNKSASTSKAEISNVASICTLQVTGRLQNSDDEENNITNGIVDLTKTESLQSLFPEAFLATTASTCKSKKRRLMERTCLRNEENSKLGTEKSNHRDATKENESINLQMDATSDALSCYKDILSICLSGV